MSEQVRVSTSNQTGVLDAYGSYSPGGIMTNSFDTLYTVDSTPGEPTMEDAENPAVEP